MDIEQLSAARSKLEHDLEQMISARLSQFRLETGISPESIYVETVNVGILSDAKPLYAVGRVTARISL